MYRLEILDVDGDVLESTTFFRYTEAVKERDREVSNRRVYGDRPPIIILYEQTVDGTWEPLE